MEKYYLGIDVGSTTVKVVALGENNRFVASRYVKANGRPRKTLAETLAELHTELDLSSVVTVGFTGSGGGLAGTTSRSLISTDDIVVSSKRSGMKGAGVI